MGVRKRQHRAPPSDRTDRSVPPLYFCLRTLSRRRTRSISVPERRASFQRLCDCAVHLPESFRGGCSFGAGSGPVSPAAMRTLECYLLCIDARCVIDYDRFVIHYSSIFEEHINVKAPAKGHLCPRYGFETRVPHGNARRVAERRQGVGRVRAMADGKIRVTTSSWDDAKVIWPNQALEVAMVGASGSRARRSPACVHRQ